MKINNLLQQLEQLNVQEIVHINGSLLNHLLGTYELLKQWGAEETLCIAGLFHAVYGTSGFEPTLVSSNDRNIIKQIIGDTAENVVYLYCAATRDSFWPQIGYCSKPEFIDRFTQDSYCLSDDEIKCFCELTAANELELAQNSEAFINKYGEYLVDLLTRMGPFLSNKANDYAKNILKY